MAFERGQTLVKIKCHLVTHFKGHVIFMKKEDHIRKATWPIRPRVSQKLLLKARHRARHLVKSNFRKMFRQKAKRGRKLPNRSRGAEDVPNGTRSCKWCTCKWVSICVFDKVERKRKRKSKILVNTIPTAGYSIRVETLGNFEGKLRLPRQNWGTLEILPR